MTSPAPAATMSVQHWTVSKARDYRSCPHRLALRRARAPRVPETIEQRRGIVLHDAIAAAYRAAQIEGRERVLDYPTDDTMHRHYLSARRALGRAWEAQKMPSSPAEANRVVDTLARLLHSLPLPRPTEVLAVEATIEGRTSGGIPVIIKPDLVLRPVSRSGVPGPLVRVIDWKLGSVDKLSARHDAQLLPYVAVLAARLHGVEQFVVELHSISNRRAVSAYADPDLVASAVLALEATAVTADADTEYRPTPGEHCMGCPFRAVCPTAWPPATLGLARDASGEFVTTVAAGR